MDKKVAADTITELSRQTAISGNGAPVPTADDMIRDFRSRLQSRISHLSNSAQKAVSKDKKTAFDISLAEARKDLRIFEDILSRIPDGFRLAPVLYTKIDEKDKSSASYGYDGALRSFRRFLAAHHAGELAALGVSPRGIANMAQGRVPVNANGKIYDISVDHILERGGSGKLAFQRGKDPARKDEPDAPEICVLNHFANFVLLPGPIHTLKNQLNDLQRHNLQIDESRWMLMLVPDNIPGRSGYVASPQQGRNHALYSLRTQEEEHLRRAELLAHDIHGLAAGKNKNNKTTTYKLLAMKETLSAAFNQISPREDMRPFLEFLHGETIQSLRDDIQLLPQEEARALGHHLRELEEKASDRTAPASSEEHLRLAEKLAGDLHAIVTEDGTNERRVARKLRAVKETLSQAFNRVSPREDMRPFLAFLQGETMQALRKDIATLPQKEAWALSNHIRDLEAKAAQRVNPKP